MIGTHHRAIGAHRRFLLGRKADRRDGRFQIPLRRCHSPAPMTSNEIAQAIPVVFVVSVVVNNTSSSFRP